MLMSLRSTWQLVTGMFFMMVGNGLLGTLLSLRAHHLGMSDAQIGVIQASNSLGCIIGCLLAPRLIKAAGHVRLMAALATMASISALVPLGTDVAAIWIAARIATGICLAGLYVAAESWIAGEPDPVTRRASLSIYFAVQTIGMSIGQLLLGFADAACTAMLLIVSMLFSLAFVPLLLSPAVNIAFQAPSRVSPMAIARAAPAAVGGAFLGGTATGALFVSLPLFGIGAGLVPANAATLVFSFTVGAALAQAPAARIAARIGPRAALGALAIAVLPICAALAQNADATSHLRLSMVVLTLGMLTGPVYALCLGHLANCCRRDAIVSGASTLTLFQATGWVVGPALAPFAMQVYGAHGLFGFVGAVEIALIALMALTHLRRSPMPATTLA